MSWSTTGYLSYRVSFELYIETPYLSAVSHTYKEPCKIQEAALSITFLSISQFSTNTQLNHVETKLVSVCKISRGLFSLTAFRQTPSLKSTGPRSVKQSTAAGTSVPQTSATSQQQDPDDSQEDANTYPDGHPLALIDDGTNSYGGYGINESAQSTAAAKITGENAGFSKKSK